MPFEQVFSTRTKWMTAFFLAKAVLIALSTYMEKTSMQACSSRTREHWELFFFAQRDAQHSARTQYLSREALASSWHLLRSSGGNGPGTRLCVFSKRGVCTRRDFFFFTTNPHVGLTSCPEGVIRQRWLNDRFGLVVRWLMLLNRPP